MTLPSVVSVAVVVEGSVEGLASFREGRMGIVMERRVADVRVVRRVRRVVKTWARILVVGWV